LSKNSDMTAVIQEKINVKPVKQERLFSFEEYLKKEEKAVDKHEFYNGKIIKMAGGKYRHNLISATCFTSYPNAIWC
jgi:Uma2 family endonuclease